MQRKLWEEEHSLGNSGGQQGQPWIPVLVLSLAGSAYVALPVKWEHYHLPSKEAWYMILLTQTLLTSSLSMEWTLNN